MQSTKSKIERLIYLLLIVTFLKGLIWAAVVPIWHTPDEQVHFAFVEFLAEKKRLPNYVLFPNLRPENDLSKEILVSEQLLGTERDQAGNNLFTYKPNFNIPYTKNLMGQYEEEIMNIPLASREEMVKLEPANYPPLYYFLGSLVYSVFYGSSLFIRVFMVRFLSVLMVTLTVYFSFKLAKEIFPENKIFQISLPLLVSFQPMFSFVGVGVNSDNLANLLFTAFTYICVKILKEGTVKKSVVILGLIIGLGLLTKPQFMVTVPIALSLFLFEARKNQWRKLFISFLFFTAALLLSGGWWMVRLYLISGSLLVMGWSASYANPNSSVSVFTYAEMAVTKLIRETLPWYWGVFKWLGVTLPRLANQIVMRVTALAGLGMVFWFVRLIKRPKFDSEKITIIFILFINFVYVGSLYLADFSFLRSHGFSIGMQGRYFFPAISSQMALLLLGIINLFPRKWLRAKKFAIIALCLGMVVLNFVALGTVFSAYYPTGNLNQALVLASQYKPWFLKGNWFVFWFSGYLVTLLILLKNYVQNSLRQPSD